MDLVEIFNDKPKATLKEDTIRLSEDSIDSQIDSVLLRYQNESSLEDDEIEQATQVSEGYKMPDNWNLLLEEDQEEEVPSTDDVMSVGNDMPRSNTPADPRTQKINLDDFAEKVSNLYNHYESLLNIKPVIVHRAMHLLERGYSGDIIDEFLEKLEREFGITLEGDAEDEVPMAPSGGVSGAVGA